MPSIQIPDTLCRVMSLYDAICFLTEANGQAAVLAKVPAHNQVGFRNAFVALRYELALYEEGPVICLFLQILDRPEQPFDIETFLDVNKPEDLALARMLAGQTTLTIHFVDEDLLLTLSKQVRHREQLRHDLTQMIEQAQQHLEQQDTTPDWYTARQRFMREVKR